MPNLSGASASHPVCRFARTQTEPGGSACHRFEHSVDEGRPTRASPRRQFSSVQVGRCAQDCYASIASDLTQAMTRTATYCITDDLVAEQVDLGLRQSWRAQSTSEPASISGSVAAILGGCSG